jgi:hypothetical protein
MESEGSFRVYMSLPRVLLLFSQMNTVYSSHLIFQESFPFLMMFQRNHLSPRFYVTFRNLFALNSESMLAPCPTTKREDLPFSVVCIRRCHTYRKAVSSVHNPRKCHKGITSCSKYQLTINRKVCRRFSLL